MTNLMTNKPIRVVTVTTGGSFIDLPQDQVQAVCKLLDASGIQYWVDPQSISIDGKPYVSMIKFRRAMNPEQVQAILDAVA